MHTNTSCLVYQFVCVYTHEQVTFVFQRKYGRLKAVCSYLEQRVISHVCDEMEVWNVLGDLLFCSRFLQSSGLFFFSPCIGFTVKLISSLLFYWFLREPCRNEHPEHGSLFWRSHLEQREWGLFGVHGLSM